MTSIIVRQHHQHHQPRHPHQAIGQSPAISSPTSKRSPLTVSRTTSRNRSNRSSVSETYEPVNNPMVDTVATGSQPNTPLSKKGGGRQRRAAGPQSRRAKGKRVEDDPGAGEIDAEGEGVEDEGNDSLFDLLGITSPPVVDGVDNEPLDKAGKGILPITRADIERSGAGDGKKQEKKGRVPRTRPDAVETEPEPKQPGGRRDKSTELTNGKQDRDANSESESKRKRPQRKTKAKPDDPSVLSASTSSPIVTTPPSTLSATRPKGEGRRQGRGKAIVEPVRQDSSDEAFETASLSQSLPSERLFGPSRSGPLDQAGAGSTNGKGRGKGKKGNALADEDDSLVWEMPQVPGPSANQALTWQQKLQSSTSTTDSPRRSTKSTPQSNSSSNFNSSPGRAGLPDRRNRSRPNTSVISPHPPSAMPPSPLVARPAPARRLSLDNNVPVSAFDHTQPFHTGFNVYRAPQTPAKLPGNMAPAHQLPILHQEFPRIAKGPVPSSYVPTPPAAPGIIPMPPISTPAHAKIKYAGPTFHNSPHGASLPKPDLDDF